MQDTQPYRRPARGQAQRARREVPRERRPANWRLRLKIGASLVAAVLVGGVILGWQRAADFNDAVSTAPALSMRLFGPFSPERVNVLLLGYSDESREGAYLSDSINVISIDKATDTTSIIAIPRDLWVEGIEEVPQNMKINEAFRIGYYTDGLTAAGELAAKTVAHVTGLEIHGWISLDFQGFQAMVDAIGGITLENPTAFEYTWAEPKWRAGDYDGGSFAAGTLALDGQLALDYARNRYTSVPAESSDFARLVRQQRVLKAIRGEITGWEAIPTGMAVADALEGHLHSNIPVLDLAQLVGRLDPDHRVELREGEILQATTNTNGQYILVVIGQTSTTDYSPLHHFTSSALEEPAASPTPSRTESPR
jgi:polyisoprenyl-teichoic acid--peptidoglycan teichoic acid transferase